MRRAARIGAISQLVLLIGGGACQLADSGDSPSGVADDHWLPFILETWDWKSPDQDATGLTLTRSAGDPNEPGSGNSDTKNGPVLLVRPLELRFGAWSYTDRFTVRNVGGGTLHYWAKADEQWVLLTDAEGTSEGEVREIGVDVDPAGLEEGEHHASILVSAERRQTTVHVVLTVESGTASSGDDPPPGDGDDPPPSDGDDPRDGESTLLRIVPWVECCLTNQFERTVEGLLIWQTATDTAIVSTSRGHAYFYTELRARVPGMRIIPGLKTCYDLERFDSVDGWEAIARELAEIQATSGERVVLLENEMALEPYVAGNESLDFEQLRAGLELLPPGLEYIWRPSIFEPSIGDGLGPERSALVCELVEEVLADVRFEEQRYCSTQAVHDPLRIAAKQRLDAIASKPTLPMQYFMGVRDDGYVWWLDEEVHVALSYIRQDWGEDADAVLYTGIDRWVEGAESLTSLLTEVGY